MTKLEPSFNLNQHFIKRSNNLFDLIENVVRPRYAGFYKIHQVEWLISFLQRFWLPLPFTPMWWINLWWLIEIQNLPGILKITCMPVPFRWFNHVVYCKIRFRITVPNIHKFSYLVCWYPWTKKICLLSTPSHPLMMAIGSWPSF